MSKISPLMLTFVCGGGMYFVMFVIISNLNRDNLLTLCS
jgi:hypothetical protein